nr:MAG: hypothetical protein DIU80_19225 [Chloroflexota bacterium]
MASSQAGAYLKSLRYKADYSTEALGEAVGVKRGTIERLEKGDDSVAIRTVTRVLSLLGASPWSYHRLATDPHLSLDVVLQHHAIARSITTYLITLATQRGIPLEMLAELMRIPLQTLSRIAGEEGHGGMLPDLALLLGLIALDGALTDVETIAQAERDHDAIARQLATQRAVYMAADQTDSALPRQMHSYPLIDSALRHLSLIQRNSQDLPAMLRQELSRAIRDLEQFQILLRALQLEPNRSV